MECALFGHKVVQVAQLWFGYIIIVLEFLVGAGVRILHFPAAAGYLVGFSLAGNFLSDGIDIFFLFICMSQFGLFSFFRTLVLKGLLLFSSKQPSGLLVNSWNLVKSNSWMCFIAF